MSIVGTTERTQDFGIVGNIGKAYEYGQRIYGDVFFGNEEIYNAKGEYGAREYGSFFYGTEGGIWGIYQRHHKKGKVSYRKLKFYIPKNPRTAPQSAWRDIFKAGMTAWANLTNEQKAVYNERAKARHLHGVNLFLREYLYSN